MRRIFLSVLTLLFLFIPSTYSYAVDAPDVPTPAQLPLAAPPCAGEITKQGCEKTFTAIGEIATDPSSYVTSIFTLLVSMSGGVALLLFITAGYRFMTSQGNPEAVKTSQETLLSAVTGLLFIIFSYILLRFIAKDVLHIPGFI